MIRPFLGTAAAAVALAAAAPPAAPPSARPDPSMQVAQAEDAGMLEEFEIEALLVKYMDEGPPLYAEHCAACHGDAGEGGQAPPLAGNAESQSTVAQIRENFVGSRPHSFADELSRTVLATVLTYVANSWSNEFGLVQRQMVSAARE